MLVGVDETTERPGGWLALEFLNALFVPEIDLPRQQRVAYALGGGSTLPIGRNAV